MKSLIKPAALKTIAATTLFISSFSWGAIALDRTRIIMDADNPSVSLTVTNESQRLPYLAQGWLENEHGEKITTPLTVLPPVQRIEPGEKSQVKIQSLPSANLLAQDKETLFYFNLREIPPRADKSNTLQVALQTKIKLFYRPASLQLSPGAYANPVQLQVRLTRVGDDYRIENPTGYYITFVGASRHEGEESVRGFAPLMVGPRQNVMLGGSAAALGDAPVLQYVNDFGGRVALHFRCQAGSCRAVAKS